MSENELWELSSGSFTPFSDVVKLVALQTVSVFVFAVIMANAHAGFHLHQMQEGTYEREALDCFLLDYIDHFNAMVFLRKRMQRVQNAAAGFVLNRYCSEEDVLNLAGYQH